MKYFLSLLSTVFFVSVSLFAKTTKPLQEKVNGINLMIDPRIELYNIIAMLGGHNGMTTSNISYKKSCLDYFSPYKSEKAPELLFKTYSNGWAIDDPIFFLLYLDENFKLRPGLHPDIIKRGGGIEHLQRLASSMRDFAVKSNFQHFFNVQQYQFYKQVLTSAKYNLKDFKAISFLEKYYGKKCNSYNLILNINSAYGNFGKQIISDNKTDLYAIIETNTFSGEIPTYLLSPSIIDLILHEFSHGFVNPLIDQYGQQLAKNEQLYQHIAGAMQAQSYWDWHVSVNEHIVRSVVTRIVEQLYGKTLSNQVFYKMMLSRRFIYADAIMKQLAIYENNRNKYPDFESFAPNLINVFDTISEDYIAKQQEKVSTIRNEELQKIPKPYEIAKDSTTLFIIGTHEANKQHESAMHDFVKKYRDMIAKDIQIITDDEALNRNLENNDLVIFGTPGGNSFLEKHIKLIPVALDENGITCGKFIKGSDLQLVTSWINPFNPAKTMAIYTAQKTENIKNFFYSATKDQYHYWIAQDLIALDLGNYEKYSEVWLPNIFQ